MRSHLSDDERREYLMLEAELGALEEDIKRARATTRPATGGLGLDLTAHHDPAHAPVHGERCRLADGAATRTSSHWGSGGSVHCRGFAVSARRSSVCHRTN